MTTKPKVDELLKVTPLQLMPPKELIYLGSNRPLDQRHVNKLISTIKTDNQLHVRPITINTRREIIDGQHRVAAALELNLDKVPCFVVLAGVESAQTINQNTKNWDSKHFAHYWAKQGKADYKEFIDFCSLTGLGQSVAINLLSGIGMQSGGRPINNFKAGLFKVKNIEYVYRFMDKLEVFKKWLGAAYHDRSFISAMWRIYNHPLYNHERMIHKLELVSLNKCSDITRYVVQLEEIYNWKVRAEERVKFKE